MFVAQRAVELQRINDAVAQEGVDHQTLLVGGDDLFLVGLQRLIALIEQDHGLQKRPFDLKARIVVVLGVDHADRLAEA